MAPSLLHKDDVCDYMEQQMMTVMYRGQKHEFLPRSALEEVTAPSVIQRVIEEDEASFTTQEVEDLVSEVHQKGRKLFALLVFCDQSMEHLRIMLANGITDSNMPREKEDFQSLKRKRGLISNFIGNQKRFNVLYLSNNSLNLDERDSNTFSIPINFEDVQSNWLGRGAFGEVWKVAIPADQRSFPCNTNDENLFAMKVTQHEGREQNYHRAMADVSHPHLVKCLTSFTFGAKYQMVYELANYDLEEFMQRFRNGRQEPGITPSWFAGQLAGLAGALRVVHNPAGSSLHVPKTKDDQARTGYIHDIKPDNILVFTYLGSTHFLKLSDFSCAKVVDVVSTISGKRESYKTGTKKGAPVYRAPEALSEGLSRPYDLWALGCVFLELLVWYIEGYKALEAFRTNREGQVVSGGVIDEGFYFQAENGSCQLRPEVKRKIKNLSLMCPAELKVIMDVIPLLLKINPRDRLTASMLAERLRHLGTNIAMGLEAGSSSSLSVPIRPSSNLRTLDSDSDFDDVIKVTRPSDE